MLRRPRSSRPPDDHSPTSPCQKQASRAVPFFFGLSVPLAVGCSHFRRRSRMRLKEMTPLMLSREKKSRHRSHRTLPGAGRAGLLPQDQHRT